MINEVKMLKELDKQINITNLLPELTVLLNKHKIGLGVTDDGRIRLVALFKNEEVKCESKTIDNEDVLVFEYENEAKGG